MPHIDKIEACADLLDPPAPGVVRWLIKRIRDLERALDLVAHCKKPEMAKVEDALVTVSCGLCLGCQALKVRAEQDVKDGSQ